MDTNYSIIENQLSPGQKRNYLRRFFLTRFLSVPEHQKRLLKSKLMFQPTKYSTSSLKLNMCPDTKIVRKYIPALGKCVDLAVPCGKCMFCLHKKQNSLIYRVFNHSKCYQHSLFITLTYNDEHYPLCDNTSVASSDIVRFFKRLRYHMDLAGAVGTSYLYCCERGSQKNRLHFHVLLWWNGFIPDKYVRYLVRLSWKDKRKSFVSVSNFNKYHGSTSPIGFVYFGDVKPSSICYVTKYSLKDSGTVFVRWSHGLGLSALDVVGNDDLVSRFRFYPLTYYDSAPDERRVLPVPKYYLDKVYSVTERDFLFFEYLKSDCYKYKIIACNSPDIMLHYSNLYESYRSRAEAKSLARSIVRKRKNRLL